MTYRLLLIVVSAPLFSGCFLVERYVADRLWEEEYGLDRSEMQTVDFCALPDHAGDLVRTKAVYSGFVEYWSLTPPDPCTPGAADTLSTAAEFEHFMPPWDRKYERRLDTLHAHASTLKAVIDVEGYFEMGRTPGYGHLGSWSSKFVILRIRDVDLVERKT
jgi:hypothetical protein